MTGFYEWQGEALVLRIKAQPKASKDEFCDVLDNRLKTRITAPPVDGRANQHLLKFLARQFKVRQSQVELLAGDTSRDKRFIIHAPQHIPDCLQSRIKPPAV